MKQVAVGTDGRIWGVNPDNQIFTRTGVEGEWKQIDGWLSQIAVGFDGRVWGVNPNN